MFKYSHKYFAYLGKDHNIKVLVTGSNGKLGSYLIKSLYQKYGISNVIASDIFDDNIYEGKYLKLDVCDKHNFNKIVKENKINIIINLAERDYRECQEDHILAKKFNIDGIYNSLDIATENKTLIFIPSTLYTYSFNGTVNDISTQNPISYYGITKLHMEQIGIWYNKTYGTNFRSLRFPLIVYNNDIFNNSKYNNIESYIVDVFRSGLYSQNYKIKLDPKVKLPIINIQEALRASMEFMDAGESYLKKRVYNVGSLSFTVEEFLKESKKVFKNISIEYDIDNDLNKIANYYPSVVDDSAAKRDWEWKSQYSNLKQYVKEFSLELVNFQINSNNKI